MLASCGRIGFDSLDSSSSATCSGDGLFCAQPVMTATCNGRCWAWCFDLVDQSHATVQCTQWGGTLLPLPTLADAACFRTTVVPVGSPWLGLVQAPGSTTVDLGWSWNGDGIPLAYMRWSSAQPDPQPDDNNSGVEIGREQCARSREGTSDWFDVHCTDNFMTACAR